MVMAYKEFSLPEEHVLGELKMKQMPPLENLKAAVLDALYHPIASAPINELVQPGMKIAFICNDSTRVANTHSFMPILVNEMNNWVLRMRICILSLLWVHIAA